MAMEEVLDAVRRIVYKWVNTESPITSDVTVGDININVVDARRFHNGDDVVLINNDSLFESNLAIDKVDTVNNIVTLAAPVLNNWTIGNNTYLRKTFYGQFVQGIYIGDPDVIMHYPAITVYGSSKDSEWFTLETTKEKYEVSIGIFVKASTHEEGYRFLTKLTDTISDGLKKNLIPLVGPYDITTLTEDVVCGEVDIKLADRDLVNSYRHIFIEDSENCQENWVTHIYSTTDDPTETSVRLLNQASFSYGANDTYVVVPQRFFHNSWPTSIDYGFIHKKELLRAAKISWFCEEVEQQFMRRNELKLN